MPNSAVSQYLYLLDEAFQGMQWHSLLGNPRPLGSEDWLWIPPGGNRSIRDIVEHIGDTKLMYENHAFGGGQLTWDRLSSKNQFATNAPSSAIDWLKSCQDRLVASVSALDDDELTRPRMANWGELKETRWIIAVMIERDLYHAGEINHIRSLRHESDRWQFEQG
jgi:uncharacterized damage-inducible protein DinB